MKVYVMYDEGGHIRGTAVPLVDSARPGIQAGLSCLVEELNVSPDKIQEHLCDLHRHSRIDVAATPHKRVSKAASEA